MKRGIHYVGRSVIRWQKALGTISKLNWRLIPVISTIRATACSSSWHACPLNLDWQQTEGKKETGNVKQREIIGILNSERGDVWTIWICTLRSVFLMWCAPVYQQEVFNLQKAKEKSIVRKNQPTYPVLWKRTFAEWKAFSVRGLIVFPGRFEMASTGGNSDEQMYRNQICAEDRLVLLSFLLYLIHANKLTQNVITDCQTASVNPTNPMLLALVRTRAQRYLP